MLGDAAFLLDESGRRMGVDRLSLSEELRLPEDSDAIDHAIRHCGFVLIQPVHHALFVELCPTKVAPLAVLAAYYEIRATPAQCIVLSSPGEWRRDQYELFSSVDNALPRLQRIARGASKRRAAEIRTGGKPSPQADRAFSSSLEEWHAADAAFPIHSPTLTEPTQL
jgi:hypothetical protein